MLLSPLFLFSDLLSEEFQIKKMFIAESIKLAVRSRLLSRGHNLARSALKTSVADNKA